MVTALFHLYVQLYDYVLRTIESRNEVHGLKTAGLDCRLVQTLC